MPVGLLVYECFITWFLLCRHDISMTDKSGGQQSDGVKGGDKSQPSAAAPSKLRSSDPYETFGYDVFPERDATKPRYSIRL